MGSGQHEDDPDIEDREMHGLFASLRRELAAVGRSFQERVLDALHEADRARSGRAPSVARLVQSTLFEALNIIADLVGATPPRLEGAPPQPPPESEPPRSQDEP